MNQKLPNAIVETVQCGLELLLIYRDNINSFEAIYSFFNICGSIESFSIKINNGKCCDFGLQGD